MIRLNTKTALEKLRYLTSKEHVSVLSATNFSKINLGKLSVSEMFLRTGKEACYEDFAVRLNEIFPNMSLKKILKKVKKGYINEGRDSAVYNIPGIEGYVIKISKKAKTGLFSKVPPLKRVQNTLYPFNFGQEIASNGKGISVLVKVEGEAHSVPKWANMCTKCKKLKSHRQVGLIKNKC